MKFQKGQLLVELLVTIALVSLMIPAILTGFTTTRGGRAQSDQRLQALSYLKEAQETIRVIRDASWAPFASTGTFTVHPVFANGAWALVQGSETIAGNFTRQIVISDVYRDNTGTIVQSGGTLDPSTKKVTSTVSWLTPLPASVSESAFVTRFMNTFHGDSTVSDFTGGITTGVTITNIAGGEVTLGTTDSNSNWCDPQDTTLARVDLNGQGVTKALSAIPGHAYTTTGGNASGYPLDSVSISDPPAPSPPVATEVTNGNYNKYKAYGVFADSSYAYLTTDHPGVTVDIVQITTVPFTETGTFNASGGGAGVSVFVNGTIGFVTVGSTLFSFDLTAKTGSRNQLGSVSLSGTGKKIMVFENYAYVVTDSALNQFQIVNVSNPTNMSIVNISGTSLQNNQAGVDLFINPSATYAFLVTQYTALQNDFFILDINSKSTPLIKGRYSTNGMNPTGVSAMPGNRAIIVGSGGEEYQVLDITDVTSPTHCGGMSPSGASAITALVPVYEADKDAFSYILTNNTSQEFQIISGGTRSDFGVFESQTLDTTSEAMFNRFATSTVTPPQTTLQFRVAIKHGINGNCSGVSFADTDFVGPDGLPGSYFPSTGGIIPPSTDGTGFENPGQCMRYRAYFSTADITQSPVLNDITFNYSP